MGQHKTLAIQFKYLGDAVILTPALKALKAQWPEDELQVLVAAEIAPLLDNLPWITRVWAMPRTRGRARLKQSWPFVQALRQEHFDRCVDFGGNDRGALLSRLSGAPVRLGTVGGEYASLLQRFCYSQCAPRSHTAISYFDAHFELLSAWGIVRPQSLSLEIGCNPRDSDAAAKLVPPGAIICHIATSQAKKEWPLVHWQALHHLAQQAGLKLVFSSGNSVRERQLLTDLEALLPDALMLPQINDLNLFLNVLKLARLVISGDTGPLHFAAGLGVPVLGIFGVDNSLREVAPIYHAHQLVKASHCACGHEFPYCQQAVSCMSSIAPAAVFARLNTLIGNNS